MLSRKHSKVTGLTLVGLRILANFAHLIVDVYQVNVSVLGDRLAIFRSVFIAASYNKVYVGAYWQPLLPFVRWLILTEMLIVC
ncbi:hypothetical protein [Pseudomonas silesiensis]|uniref:hypothetical protein n=1 Tax=Pseudomonas silesiensis TaxID=1853130 RepID=UPI0034D75086